MPSVSAIILAGGKSTRMGRDKAVLPVAGMRIIDRVIGTMRALSDDLVIVTNTPRMYLDLDLPLVADLIPDCGSLGGIFTGVAFSAHEHALVVACDMPFLSEPLLRHMLTLVGEADLVLPFSPHGSEPLHAVYSKACLSPMVSLLRERRLKIDGLFPLVRVRALSPDEVGHFDPEYQSFLNVNTPQELAAADRLAAPAGSGR